MTTANLPSTWSGQWIGPTDDDGSDVWRPGFHLAREVELDRVPERATLYLTAHGLVEPFVNGIRVSDHELMPGFTAYRDRLQVFELDLTGALRAGANAIGFVLTDGWWRGQTSVVRKANRYGATVGVFAELHLEFDDGQRSVVATDDSWVWTTGHIIAADLMAGEHHDYTKHVDGWAEAGTDRSSWRRVAVQSGSADTFVPAIAPAVRRIEEIPAVDIRQVGDHRHIVDFGRNTNGWIRLTNLGPKGTVLTIEHSEALSPDGLAAQNECHNTDFALDGTPFQTDTVVSAGDGSVFEPRHSTKGFQYVVVDGHPGPLAASDFTSITVRNELAPLGSFASSNEDLNALHRAAEWSLLTNCCDIPTDCPTRERAGWTGDWQIFVDTAAYLYDVTDFSRKWLLDLAADQLPNGAVGNFIPEPADFTDPATHWWRDLQGSAGWGDAAVHVPWEIYRATGDTTVLAELYPTMVRWVEFARERAATGRHDERVAARPEAAEHEQFLWDSGFHFGEWNEPGAEEGQIQRIQVIDHGPTATAFLHRSAAELAEIAELLGHHDASADYRTFAANVLDAWRIEFVDDDGRVRPRTQANLVRSLAFGLIPDEFRATAVADLVSLLEEDGFHLGTGFLSTPFLLPTLADHGHADAAFRILFQRTFPSWLGMLDAGANTIWEGWDSMKEDGSVTSSLNHFSMGAVISFLHRYVAGLELLEPGYRRFSVRPTPHELVTWARTSHLSPLGEISVSWQVEDGAGTIDVTVPSGATAEVTLPDGRQSTLADGAHQLTWQA